MTPTQQARKRDALDYLRLAGLAELANEIEHGCLDLDPGEPFFVLRGQDVTAASTVRLWILENQGTCPPLKLEAAMAIADRMGFWPVKKNAD